MAERLSPLVPLPTRMDPSLRQALSDFFRQVVREVNWKAYDISAIASSKAVGSDIVLVDASASAVAVTLPYAKDWRDRVMRVKKVDAGANYVSVIPQSGETLDGTATVAITTPNTCLQIVSANGNWFIV